VNEGGEPTLAEQGKTAEADRLNLAKAHPLVQAVLAAFPGAKIEAVRDASLDAYGLARPWRPTWPRRMAATSRRPTPKRPG
jgi:DNA polymerase-3 subunit gamma/tau